jgi:hypothetical protein
VARKAQRWTPRAELSQREERILRLCKKHKLYAFFRLHRHEIFDDEIQERLMATYSEGGHGDEPKPPAQLAMAMLMQAAFGEPDHEVPTLTAVDQRWQMVLDCMDREKPLLSQGTVFNFRMRAIANGVGRMLVDKTVELARKTRAYSAKKLRVALDSSPLAGAGRVEDTFNLIGHAAHDVLRTAAQCLGREPEEIAEEAGIPLATASSIKAGLDMDWNQPDARKRGLQILISQVKALQHWLEQELAEALKEPPLSQQWETVQRLIDQDTEPDPDGEGRRITDGTAPDRQISVTDPDMRHGRKSRSQTIKGYKRHIALDLDIPGLICATKSTSANVPDKGAVGPLVDWLEQDGATIGEAHVDRAYVEAPELHQRQATGLKVITKPHPVGNRPGLFTKADFRFNFSKKKVTCPAGEIIRLRLGTTVKFPAESCDSCALRSRCTTCKKGSGRTLHVHPREPFQAKLRRQSRTPEGREARRERVAVEHGLARIGHIQGTKAVFKGEAKNDFDLQRRAVINNCYVLDRLWRDAA